MPNTIEKINYISKHSSLKIEKFNSIATPHLKQKKTRVATQLKNSPVAIKLKRSLIATKLKKKKWKKISEYLTTPMPLVLYHLKTYGRVGGKKIKLTRIKYRLLITHWGRDALSLFSAWEIHLQGKIHWALFIMETNHLVFGRLLLEFDTR